MKNIKYTIIIALLAYIISYIKWTNMINIIKSESISTNINEIINNIDSGDIIFFAKTKLSYPSDIFFPIASSAINSPFRHVGIVIKRKDIEPEILHFVNNDYSIQYEWIKYNGKQSNIQISPLKYFMERYNNKYECNIKIFKNGIPANLYIISDFHDYKFLSGYYHFLRYLGINLDNDKNINCNMFIGMYIEKTGYFPKSTNRFKDYMINNLMNKLERIGYKCLSYNLNKIEK